MHCYRPTAKVPINMVGKSVQESSQNQPSDGVGEDGGGGGSTQGRISVCPTSLMVCL